MRELTTPEAAVAVSWAGIIPYVAERPSIDLLGSIPISVLAQELEEGTAVAFQLDGPDSRQAEQA